MTLGWGGGCHGGRRAGLGQAEGSVRNKGQPWNGELAIEKPVRVLTGKVPQLGIAAAVGRGADSTHV